MSRGKSAAVTKVLSSRLRPTLLPTDANFTNRANMLLICTLRRNSPLYILHQFVTGYLQKVFYFFFANTSRKCKLQIPKPFETSKKDNGKTIDTLGGICIVCLVFFYVIYALSLVSFLETK